MNEEKLEEILVKKGLPTVTANRIHSQPYVNMISSENQTSISYRSDRVLHETDLELRDSDLEYLGVDLSENKVLYYDQFNMCKIGYSEDDFKTSVFLDSHDTPWVVDNVEDSSYYFNPESQEFLPTYHPEIVDPIDFISEIWKETKEQARNG